jgi:flagellar basal-body rod protein FlgB
MADPIFSDDAMRASKMALDGLALRQELIGRNLANVDTPGYRAQSIKFENALLRALRKTETVSLKATHQGHLGAAVSNPGVQIIPRPGGAARADGNNVDIDVELSQMAETGLRYQALTQSVSKKLLMLKNIASGR